MAEPVDTNRARLDAKEALTWHMRDFCANLLRVMAGGGKGYEIVSGFVETLKALENYREAHGHWPSSQFFAEALDPLSTLYELRPWIKSNETDEHRRYHQVEYDIYRATLRVVASTFVNQLSQMTQARYAAVDAFREFEALKDARNFGRG
jgi:hypothetical protein